jgi:predicted anti-sigma-YlaC factor YlaD
VESAGSLDRLTPQRYIMGSAMIFRRQRRAGTGGGLALEIRVVLSCLIALTLTGCSIRSMAINSLADSLAASGNVFASDEDPELVRDATPFALKTIESLLAERPNHAQLLLAACSGFTQYGYAFVQVEAEQIQEDDYQESERQYDRALALYLRGRDYCFRLLNQHWPGIVERLSKNPEAAVEVFTKQDIELVFWTGASWGAAIAIGQDRPELVADLPAVKALMGRALALDETFDHGAIHGVLISLNALPEAMGGSPEKARFHFQRAVELAGGASAGPYVSLAQGVVVAEQNWEEFQGLLEAALAVDPDKAPSIRLVNAIEQRRARWLLDRIDLYFVDYPVSEE